MERCRIDLAGGGKYVLRHDGGEPAVDKRRVGELGGGNPVPRDVDAVDARHIGSVERADVTRVGGIARPEYLPGSERKPADLRPDRPGEIEPNSGAAEK